MIFDELAEDLARQQPRIRPPAKSSTERWREHAARKRGKAIDNVAVLDMETDPFDKTTQSPVHPFLAVLYSDNFEPIVIWENNHEVLISKVVHAINHLPGNYTIYAHNGGGFDFMFLIHRLRGTVVFKGKSIMEASIGNHRLRDSFHLIPAKLSSYKKDKILYENMDKRKREKYRQEITDYCISDCRYLLDLVKTFLKTYGFRISIGQAAISEIRKNYDVERMGAHRDAEIRQFFHGGRVDCLAGRGYFKDLYHLHDVNSMYPYVMAHYDHPISRDYYVRRGKPGDNTVFIELECRNRGGLICPQPHTSSLTRFMTTIWEYRVALQYSLITDISIIKCIDFQKRSNFSKSVLPLYSRRQETKDLLKKLRDQGISPGSQTYDDTFKDDLFLKFLLNNMYGKFAQNGRKFKEHYITDPGERPPEPWFENLRLDGETNDEIRHERLRYAFPFFENDEYSIWQRPSPSLRFNNVGTAASITGAARAVLLDALCRSREPIYCDTDSIVCKGLENVELSDTKLGAWKVEWDANEVIIAGKKLYGYRPAGKHATIKSKGTNGLVWQDLEGLLDGTYTDDHPLETVNFAPTLTKQGQQFYMKRNIRATAGVSTWEYRA